MDRFLQCVPALSNKDQNEASAVITDSDTDSNVNANVVLEISLNNSSCEVERVIQDLGNETNDMSTDDSGPSTTVTDSNPWPYIKEFFLFIGMKSNKKNLEYQYLLCKASCKMFSCSATFMNNLKKHVERSHPTSLKKFQSCIDAHKSKRKRKQTKESELTQNPAKMKLVQTSVTEKHQPRPRKQEYDNKVSFYAVF